MFERACHDVMAELVPTKTVRLFEKFIDQLNPTLDAAAMFNQSLKNAAALLMFRYRNHYTMQLFRDELNVDRFAPFYCFLDDEVAKQRFAQFYHVPAQLCCKFGSQVVFGNIECDLHGATAGP